MNKNVLIEKFLLLTLILFSISIFAADEKKTTTKKEKEISITGGVESITDDDDAVIGVSIWDFKLFSEYLVASNNQEKKLLKYVGKTVKITGTVTENEEGDNILTVNKFEEVKENNKD